MFTRASAFVSVALVVFVAFALYIGGGGIVGFGSEAHAQSSGRQPATQQPGARERTGGPIQGLSRQPSEAVRGTLLDPDDTVILLLDHQTGLLQTVKDVPITELRNNTLGLANIAQLAGAPVIMTASEPAGPNGPLFEELQQLLEEGGERVQYVPRQGEISVWDNADFVEAAEATGRKTLVMAGIWTSVCVAFPALQAQADGYEVYAVMDASGDPSEMASLATLARLTQAGVIPVSTNVILCEFQRTWNRPDALQWGEIYQQLIPHYRAVAESYNKAQEVAKEPKSNGP